jgi:hypothetical protein
VEKMIELKKHWITVVGILFILSSIIYGLKMAGWITNELKIGAGLVVGAGLIIAGIKLMQRKQENVSQIIAGLGVGVLYTTFSFAGIYYSLWTPLTVFLCMLALTIVLSLYAYRFNLRLFMNISLCSGLISPLVLQSSQDLVFTLFLYLLVINASYFYISLKKNWLELRTISFVGTWILYAAYYVHFDPAFWVTPYKYAISAFIFYVAAFVFSSWKDSLKFAGLNLYLGIVNAVVFGLWSLLILDKNNISFSVPLIAMGMIYIIAALIIYRLTKSITLPVMIKFFGGVMLILAASSQLGANFSAKPIISVFVWSGISILLFIIWRVKKLESLLIASVIIWLVIGIYWFSTTWTTTRGIWFDVYMPFLNWAGLAWMALAALGFYYSIKANLNKWSSESNLILSMVLSILSHLIVGGLLKLQVMNMWEYYGDSFLKHVDQNLTLSMVYGFYALLLFLWGAYSRQTIYKGFGSIVLVLVAFKVFFLDGSGTEQLYKVITLFVMGVLYLLISYVNTKWSAKV